MRIRRASLLTAAVIVLAAVYLLYEPPLPGRTQTPGPIDVGGDVSAAQCAPCHLRIAEALKPGIIFDHGNHLVIACSACHYAMPHQNGQTYTPPMEACFNCHGIQHGPQGELARGGCSACHTKSFKLRPATHTSDWKGKPHADRSKSGVNSCLMCHNSVKDCDGCHLKQNVLVDGRPIGPMPKSYIPISPIKTNRTTVMIYPDRPTTMGQCIYCHPDIDSFNKSKVIFAHAEHLRRDYKCTVCHPEFGHGAETVRRPSMETCYQCHGLTHSAGGLVATEDCSKCHPKTFELKPSNHTPAFESGKHKARASSDPAYCSMCHKSDFCVDCHQGRLRLRDGTYSARVVPADHKLGAWRTKHGGLYLQQQGSCGACHDSPSCTTCHYTPMPHPTEWLSNHGKAAKAIDEKVRDCNVCHVDRERCQACHHDRVKRAELIAANCTPCHDVMKQKPATSIPVKGFAEHAVHFDVAKKKGKPYMCDDCHVGFGTGSATHASNLRQAAHDLRLCYSCHGALDYENTLIAPYPGAELCVRCHQKLNIF
ncbi:MAG TPA: cytochrome c3 family protein [Coriobacteriia bacterium]